MSYLWQEFNIKTFESETFVFRNGVFCEELSEYKSGEFNKEKNLISVNKTSKIPIHIICIGEIAGNFNINIDILAPDNKIVMTGKIITKNPAFLNIFVKNAGKNSIFDGKVIVKNFEKLKVNVVGQHLTENTCIFIRTRVAAYKNSESILDGSAVIEKNISDCDSDISFSVMADENAKIKLSPTQYISSIPKSAKHSASLYKPKDNQINYLRTSGLSGAEIKQILEEAFLEQ